MACNDNKKKYECGGKVLASCTFYEGELPEWSKLKDENCVTVEEVLEELYTKVTELSDSCSLKGFNSDCVKVEEKDKMVNIMNKISNQVCNMTSNSNSTDEGNTSHSKKILAKNISLEGIDLGCFQGVCDENIYDLEGFLKSLIAKNCK